MSELPKKKGEGKFLLGVGWTASVFAGLGMAIALAGALYAVAVLVRKLL